jgi:hypothetical protein
MVMIRESSLHASKEHIFLRFVADCDVLEGRLNMSW